MKTSTQGVLTADRLAELEKQALKKYLGFINVKEDRKRITYHPSNNRVLFRHLKYAISDTARKTLMDIILRIRILG